MKPILLILFFCTLLSNVSGQINSDFGKDGEAIITLIDTELTVFEDRTNSIFKFIIVNNNEYPIYIPQPELKSGTIPQYFDLRNKSVACEMEFMEMITRNASEFILIPANSSKTFELHKDFFKNSCLKFDTPKTATLVYRASKYKEEDLVFTSELMRNSRESRDITEYFLTTKLKSEPIKIIYKDRSKN